MAETSVGYKCPNCSAPLTFLPGHDKVTCEYCGTELEVKTIEEMYAAKEATAEFGDYHSAEAVAHMVHFYIGDLVETELVLP